MVTSPILIRDWRLFGALLVIGALALGSIVIGVYDLQFDRVLSGRQTLQESLVLAVSRVPRTVAIILVGVSMSVAGLIMQLLAQNRFVSPSTSGTVEAASLGILTVTLLAPGTPLMLKMAAASVFALAGTGVFLALLRAVPLRTPLVVPLVGIMFGQVIAAVTTFFAYRYDLLQSLAAWTSGDFSRVLRGRYELLWLCAVLTLIAFMTADRFTVAGLGEAFTTNLGMNYQQVLFLGLSVVAVVTAVNVVTVGAIPFLGLIVPNVARMTMGDNVRRTAPWCALFGAGFLLLCDIAGRVIRYPYEVPIGTVVGVAGSIIFLVMLLRGSARVG